MPEENKDMHTQALRIMDKEPQLQPGENEPVEDFMARVLFAQKTGMRLADGRYVNFDDGDNKLKAGELQAVLDDPALRGQLSEAMIAHLEGTIKKNVGSDSILELEEIQKIMRSTLQGVEADGSKTDVKQGTTWYNKYAAYDVNSDGKITRGEYQYCEMERQKEQQEGADEQLKPPLTPKPKPEEKKPGPKKKEAYHVLYP